MREDAKVSSRHQRALESLDRWTQASGAPLLVIDPIGDGESLRVGIDDIRRIRGRGYALALTPASGSADDDCPPPVLDAGAHHGPQDGMCVMEAVSVVAGLPWTDSPACTNATLSLAARLINDALSDRTRARLVDLVPALSRASGRDLDTDWQVVEAACQFAATDRSRRRSRTMNRWMWLATRLDVAALRPPMAWLVRQGAARRAVEAAVVSVLTSRGADPETRCVEMLARMTNAAVPERSVGGVAVPPAPTVLVSS